MGVGLEGEVILLHRHTRPGGATTSCYHLLKAFNLSAQVVLSQSANYEKNQSGIVCLGRYRDGQGEKPNDKFSKLYAKQAISRQVILAGRMMDNPCFPTLLVY